MVALLQLQTLFTVNILNFRDPFYDQWLAVKSRYLLTSITGSGKELIEITCFLKLTTEQELGFLLDDGLMYNQGQVVWKPVNAKPRIKLNRSINFFVQKCFSLLMLGAV